jgi:putative transposase
VLKRYSYEFMPGASARLALAHTFGCTRVVFNDYLALNQVRHQAGEKFLGAKAAMPLLLTAAKQSPERAWLSGVSNIALQQAILQGERAYRNFFDSVTGKRKGRKAGFPRFRSRKTHRDSFALTRGGFRIRGGWQNTGAGGGRLVLARIGSVPVVWSRPLPAEPSSITVTRRPDGRFFVSFVVDVPAVEVPLADPGRVAGVDVGLGSFAAVTCSDGTRHKIVNPRHLRAAERRLARAQKSHSRKQRGSRNRDKARLQVARLHQHVADQRLNHAHQVATILIRENQTVGVESLGITGMVRTRLAKSISDVAWGQFLRILDEKAAETGRTVVHVPRNFPSTRLCSACGVVGGSKPLSVREWTCEHCGTRLDRDFNAAVNLMVAAGQVETLNACGREVRLRLAQPEEALLGEAGTRPTERLAA